MKRRFLLLWMIMILIIPLASRAADPPFDAYWHDGKAELDGYRITVSRYGELRNGRCVMIYVTEPFSDSKRVKVEDHKKNPKDTFDVLKLNLVRDFQTGIYDYNTMVSLFVKSADFSPVKLTFSSAEWCGHVYEELIFYPEEIRGTYSSYFEDESGSHVLERHPDGIIEDNLFILLRGLRGEFLKPGDSKKAKLLPSPFFRRLAHKQVAWSDAEISRLRKTESLVVPGGEFSTIVYVVKTADGREGRFHVEARYPHRIIYWEMPPDLKGEFTGSDRLEYWRLHGNGDEKYLQALGF